MANKRIFQGEKARDFTLINTLGESISLTNFEGLQNIFLVFNRGFT